MSQSDGNPPTEETLTSDEPPARSKRKQRKHPKLFAFFKWAAIACTVLFVALVVAGYIMYRSVDIPEANAEFQTETTYVYYSDGKSVLGKFETQNREAVELDKVPELMQAAAIAAEDRTFYDNRGIDVRGIARAAMNNATSETTQGASTITQQYVKIAYLSQEQTYSRKVKEAILALKVHNQLSKEEILERYLNTIYFGRGAYGVQTAAQAFFDVDVEDLNLRQSAVLAAIINNPSGYDPANGKAARRDLKERYDYVLDGMAEMGVEKKAVERAQRGLPKFPDIETKNRYQGPRGHLLRLVELELQEEGFSDTQINGGGMKVVTTFDRKDMNAARHAVREQQQATGLKEATGKDGMRGLHIGLASVENDSGALRAMYGGPDYLESQYNWAYHGAQPGSTFKPFALAAALDDGFSLQSSVNGSSPLAVPGGTIGNQGDQSYGTVSLQQATQDSVNTAYVDLMLQMEDGPKKTIRAARRAGIPVRDVFSRQDRRSPPWVTPLGYAPTSVIDMASAYSTFGNNGVHNDWYVIEEVDDSDGRKVFDHDSDGPKPKRGFSEDVASDVAYALQQTVLSGTATSGATLCPTGGKTGTATAGDDEHVSSAWFTGLTPEISTAVMYVRGPNGNGDIQYRNDGSLYMPEYFGGSYPAYTFKSYMDEVVDPENCGEFPQPAYVDAEEGDTYVPETDEDEESDDSFQGPPEDQEPRDEGPRNDDQGPRDEGPRDEGPRDEGPQNDDQGPREDGPQDDDQQGPPDDGPDLQEQGPQNDQQQGPPDNESGPQNGGPENGGPQEGGPENGGQQDGGSQNNGGTQQNGGTQNDGGSTGG